MNNPGSAKEIHENSARKILHFHFDKNSRLKADVAPIRKSCCESAQGAEAAAAETATAANVATVANEGKKSS